MFRIFITVLILHFSSSAQVDYKNSSYSKKRVQSEIFTFAKDSVYKAYYLFKVPYSSLVFEKDNSKFISKFEITIEVKNSTEQIVQRKFIKDIIELNEYQKTISDIDVYSNFIEFELSADTFLCNVNYTDLITGKTFWIYNHKIDLLRTKDLPRWLLVNQNQTNGVPYFEVDIFGNTVPHSQNNYDLLVTGDFDFSEVEQVTVKSEDSVLVKYEFLKYNFISPIFKLNKNKHILEINSELESKQKNNSILIKNFNEKLFEGKYIVELSGEKGNLIKSFPILVSWIDKPKSLMDYNLALEMIEFIEVDESFRTYFSSENEKKKKLYNYWNQKDPTPATAFNELMNEFYLRVDYAQNEFISISQRNGAKTDRGKIFILNGKPERIDRNVNSEGKVIESWYYKNPYRVFSFIDSRGDGNFKSLQ